jgi:hypothetical protein
VSAGAEDRMAALQERVEAHEQELRSAVDELESAARRAVDVRHWIRSRPVALTLSAFAVGIWLGGRRMGSRRMGARR